MSKKRKRVPYPKRDIVTLLFSFGFYGKLEAVGKNVLADSYITNSLMQLFYKGLHSFELTFISF